MLGATCHANIRKSSPRNVWDTCSLGKSYTSLDFNVRVHCSSFTDCYNCILVKIIMLLKCELMFLDIGGNKEKSLVRIVLNPA